MWWTIGQRPMKTKVVLSFRSVLSTSGKWKLIILLLAKPLENTGTDHYFLLLFSLKSLERARFTRHFKKDRLWKQLSGNNPDVPQQVNVVPLNNRYYSATKNEWTVGTQIPWMNFKCILLNDTQSYKLYYPIYIIFCKRQNYMDRYQVSWISPGNLLCLMKLWHKW